MTGPQWRTAQRLREDGWLILESDPTLWSDELVARIEEGLAFRSSEDGRRRVAYLAEQEARRRSAVEILPPTQGGE